MKKALLVVHRYKSEKDADWGSVATDFGTADMIGNIAKLYTDYDWRPATLTEARQLLHEIEIDLLMLVPILKGYAEEFNAYPHVEVDYLKVGEYGNISKPPFPFMRKEKFK